MMTFFVDENNNLKCYDNLSQTATIMETGVENLQFRFRTSGETAQFMVAPAATSPSWNDIQIIEYAMLVAKAYQQFQLDGLVEVQRGVGMFVARGAAEKLRSSEREQFLVVEWPAIRRRIERLGIAPAQLLAEIS